MLSNNGLCLCAAAQYMLLFLVLAINFTRFQLLRCYTLLLKPPALGRDIWPHNEDVDWSYSNLCLENSRLSYYKLGYLLDDWLYKLVAYGPRCLPGDNWCVLIGQFQAPFQPHVGPSDWADPAHWLWRLFWGCHDTGEVPWEDPLPTDTHAHQCHGGKAHTRAMSRDHLWSVWPY